MTMAERFLNRLENMLPNLIEAALILAAGYFITRLTLKIMSKGLNIKHVDPTIHKFLMSMVRVTITVFVLVMALSAMNVPMSSIIAAIGTAGLAIGLALQDSLSNVAGGFVILFSQPFKCGDYVQIGADEGTVDMISILYTKLLTIDNRAVFIPNSSVAKSTVINLTAEDRRRLELKFSIGYNDDHRAAMEVIRQTVKADNRVLTDAGEPLIALCEHGSSALILMLRVWVPTESYWDIRFDLLAGVKEAFDENGINIPYDQLDVHLHKE